MEQIPDAPYIREAEMYGMPPYEDEPDFTEQINSLAQCDRECDAVIDILTAVEDDLSGTIYENQIHDIISAVEDIGCDIRLAMAKVKGIA